MKKKNAKGLLLFLSIISCILLVCAIYIVVKNQDTTEPEILFSDEAIFLSAEEAEEVENGDYSCLLNDATAEDNKDGDITQRLFVNAVDLFGEDTYGIIRYEVMDHAGNVASRQRICYLCSMQEIYEKILNQYSDLVKEDSQETEEADEKNEEKNVDNDVPILRMEENVTITAGSECNLQDYIEALYDDTDSIRTLLQNISVDGEYDVDIPGKYVLSFYVTDSDGNVSEPSVIYLTVE